MENTFASWTNTELAYQDFCTKLIVAIKGAPEDVEADFWGFFNHSATDAGLYHFGEAEIDWLTPTTAKFYTTRERLLAGMESRALHKILNDNPNAYKGQKGGAQAAARELAQEWFDSMERVTDIIRKNVRETVYSMGTITAEKPDSDYGNRESA